MKNQTTVLQSIVPNRVIACLRAANLIAGICAGRRTLCRILTTALFLLMCMTVTVAQSAQTNLPTIFVAPMSGGSNLRSWQASIGQSIADALVNQLATGRKFGVLETSALEMLRKEIAMSKDGWMEPSEKVEKGHWFGADYMLTGKLTHFELPSKGSGGGVIQGIPGMFQKKVKVQILWRVVNTSTREVVASGTADSSRARERFSFTRTARNILNGSEDGGEALERALELVLAQIVGEVEGLDLRPTERTAVAVNRHKLGTGGARSASGIIEAVKPDFLIVALGTKHGCKAGDKLELCEFNEIKNAEGETVFKEPKVVGEAEIEMCLEDRSKARYSSLVTPKEGWIVRCKAPSGQ